MHDMTPDPLLLPPLGRYESEAEAVQRKAWQAEALRQLQRLGLGVVAMRNLAGTANLDRFRACYDEATGAMAALERLQSQGWRNNQRRGGA